MTKIEAPSVFIGSSSEGLEIARHLQADLEQSGVCSVVRWDQGIFQASSYAIPQLESAARSVDFAVLIATADDVVQSRGLERAAARDNIYFELGLFIGALGLERTYVVSASRSLQLPTDLSGLTWLPYRERADGNIRAGLNDATLGITNRARELGRRAGRKVRADSHASGGHRQALAEEIAQICADAEAQGWVVRTNSSTVLRVRSPKGRSFAFTFGEPASSRQEIRGFASQLRANGLRVSRSVRRPVDESPIPL
ncbi:nucleotide-binding protein [Curtobacterium sp. MCPF17_051]|uniref:nucleotide-binding protein n=1 Tax=Curtobacterium sp. MCPF17_051 TaxID=2175640 RepID=UPI000DA7A768|nr:hypothetical protein DEJ35_05480 [Curtobacterium sp. MCPF17_051]